MGEEIGRHFCIAGARDLGLAFERVSKRKTIRRNTERSAAPNFTLAGQIKISARGR
ncbi:MAG: hypothetical protein ABSE67_21110 [Xanthobacteraceae bacterium]